MLVIDLEDLYFEWLLGCLDPDGVTEGLAYLCGLLHNCEFHRRVGNDINRAIDGADLRKEFFMSFESSEFDPHITNDLALQECSWLEMLIALSRRLDFLYDGGVEGRFVELITNLRLDDLAYHDPHRTLAQMKRDQREVDIATADFDANRFLINGVGGLFPLRSREHQDQRKIEIWDQAGSYFNERL